MIGIYMLVAGIVFTLYNNDVTEH